MPELPRGTVTFLFTDIRTAPIQQQAAGRRIAGPMPQELKGADAVDGDRELRQIIAEPVRPSRRIAGAALQPHPPYLRRVEQHVETDRAVGAAGHRHPNHCLEGAGEVDELRRIAPDGIDRDPAVGRDHGFGRLS
jgi:hypothetical protein